MKRLMIYLIRRPWVFGVLVMVVFGGLFWFSLPSRLFDDPLASMLLSRDGHLLGARIASDEQWRFPLIGGVPEKYKTALIHFEDKRFYRHPGVDPVALFRAFVLNVKNGRRVSGGSTISMQVVRLSRRNPSRSYFEKVREVFLALRLEMSYSKEQIMAFYAANAPFGGNIVGLEAASRFYFGRTAGRLSWGESALLAVLPNSPSLIHPGRNRETLKKKRDDLLAVLNEKGIISSLEYKLAVGEPLPPRPRPVPRLAPHLMQTLIKAQADNQQSEKKSSYNAFNGSLLNESSLKNPSVKRHAPKEEKGNPVSPGGSSVVFHTTIRRDHQVRVTEICNRHARKLVQQDIRNLAAVVIDNATGTVVAYIGNCDNGTVAQYGQAVDILTARRSTGSILKPFLFAAMLDSGDITPGMLVPDVPSRFGGFMPENYDRTYQGAVPAKNALAQSLNIPAVRMLRTYGVHRFHDFLQRNGMTTLSRSADNYGLTLILGGAEARLVEMAEMYSNLARLVTSDGDVFPAVTVLKDGPSRPAALSNIGPGAAYLTLEALLDVVRPGVEGHWRNFGSSRKIAWKTGTSYGLRDAWAIGVTPRHTVGVWVGNADGEGKSGLTGLGVAAPVLFDIFNALPDGRWFDRPEIDLKNVRLCTLSGYLAGPHCEGHEVEVPFGSRFNKQCPHHQLVHLGPDGYRVDSRCESVARMSHRTWFTLPPVQEYYYCKHNPGYRKLPPFRPGSGLDLEHRSQSGGGVMNLEYPSVRTAVYIPVDLDGLRGSVVFRALHRRPDTVIYWHLDQQYLGQTKTFHQVSVAPSPGKHRLILVDQQGNRMERTFTVLNKSQN